MLSIGLPLFVLAGSLGQGAEDHRLDRRGMQSAVALVKGCSRSV